jgi:RimJ/RimL family protein N-acetyltransferase
VSETVNLAPIEVHPVTLAGRWVRLEPLRAEHFAALSAIAGDEEIWEWYPWPLNEAGALRSWVDTALANERAGDDLPFVIVERDTGSIAGSTRYLDIRPGHRALEIGNTWLGRPWWRTAINSEAKYLLLSHAFDTLGCLRVSLKTDALNERSRRAIERLGAQYEGTLRKHMIVHDGRVRDTVYYSITDEEWPRIRERMEAALYGGVSGATLDPR